MKGEGHRGHFCFILLSILSTFEVSTTTVTIRSVGSLRKSASVQCGSKDTFICSIPTYKYTMRWLIDSDKVAECVTTNCVQYPPYKVDSIEFTPNTRIGEFNMTINPVTLKANGRKIKCIYGSEGVQLKLAVKVFPTKKTTEIFESKHDNGNMIKIIATTGCVFPSSAITMQWYYYEEGHKPKLYKMSSPTVARNFSVCKSGPCGGNGVVKMSTTLSILEEQIGKLFFFQIAVGHEDTGDIILVNSTRSYKINEIPNETRHEPAHQVAGIEQDKVVLLIIVVIVVIVVIVPLEVIVVRKLLVSRGHTRSNDQQRKKAPEDKLLGDRDRTNEERNKDEIRDLDGGYLLSLQSLTVF